MKKFISAISPHSRAFFWAIIFSAFVGMLSFFTYVTLAQWEEQVVESNTMLCDLFAEQLSLSAVPVVDSLEQDFPKNKNILDQIKNADTRLARITQKLFERAQGLEGGFFYRRYDRFIGYAYPTSPPPKPVYGPPPRSFNIIKRQVLETINSRSAITRLHQFDPAIFPLVTRPILYKNKVIGAIWVRTHIERELPYLKLRQVINFGALLALLGFLIAGFISFNLRKKIKQLNADFKQIELDPRHQITTLPGTLGIIGNSINRMVKTLDIEHSRREQLERELHQKEKLASLGRLLAGVAHEIKTPLAILKTRIQMWQHDLRNLDTQNLPASLNQESMQMVVDETDRLDGLIKKLLYLSRPVKRHLKPTDLNEVILHTIKVLETEGRCVPGQIEMQTTSALPLALIDLAAMEQVLINVLTNALEAAEPASPVTIRTTASENCIQIDISDLGSGIAADDEQHIFDPFFSTKQKGFGLGLSIAYEIVMAHQGQIKFSPNNPQGSICSISIPIAQEVAQNDG